MTVVDGWVCTGAGTPRAGAVCACRFVGVAWPSSQSARGLSVGDSGSGAIQTGLVMPICSPKLLCFSHRAKHGGGGQDHGDQVGERVAC